MLPEPLPDDVADATLAPFFNPRGVVVIGASPDPAKLGHGVADNLVRSGYRGTIAFVNPKGGRLLDRLVYADVAAVPDPVDLAVLIVPAAAVPDALRACAKRGVQAAVILSGGFREVGPAGEALEAECLRIARAAGMRLLGPNCVGLIDTHLPLNTTFLPAPPIPGEVAFISHSGAICVAVTDWATGLGFGLSRLVSLGNQADITEADVLAPVAEDPRTRVLTLYLEGMGDGRRFVDRARDVARRTPIIALKVGRSAGGRRAAASHTGALAGTEVAYDAAFRRSGVMRAQTSEEMFDWARALAWCPLPRGREIAVLTNAGGPGVIAADAIEAQGLHLAAFTDATRQALRRLLPSVVTVRNPLDIVASATGEQYASSLRLLLADTAVSGVVVILPPPPREAAEAVIEPLIPVIRAGGKAVTVALMGDQAVRRAADLLRAAHIPDYRCPERAVSAMAALAGRAEMLARPKVAPVRFADMQPEVVHDLVARSTGGAAGDAGASEAEQIVAAYGIRVSPGGLARTAEEAVTLASGMGVPVVLKIASPDISHKTDVGGVLLDVRGSAAVAEGFDRISRSARRARPEARITGVRVQPMLVCGQELIVGAVQDPQFGPLVMAGSGGVEVEARGDVAFALAPLSREEAEDLLDRTWGGRRLGGVRGAPPADRTAMVDVILRLGQLAAEWPQLTEIDINPLYVLPQGQGAVAVDVRIRVGRGLSPCPRPGTDPNGSLRGQTPEKAAGR